LKIVLQVFYLFAALQPFEPSEPSESFHLTRMAMLIHSARGRQAAKSLDNELLGGSRVQSTAHLREDEVHNWATEAGDDRPDEEFFSRGRAMSCHTRWDDESEEKEGDHSCGNHHLEHVQGNVRGAAVRKPLPQRGSLGVGQTRQDWRVEEVIVDIGSVAYDRPMKREHVQNSMTQDDAARKVQGAVRGREARMSEKQPSVMAHAMTYCCTSHGLVLCCLLVISGAIILSTVFGVASQRG